MDIQNFLLKFAIQTNKYSKNMEIQKLPERINVRGTLRQMEVGEVCRMGLEANPKYVRQVACEIGLLEQKSFSISCTKTSNNITVTRVS